MLKKIYYKIFPTYKVLENKYVSYLEADKMLKDSHLKSESEKWVLAKEEDFNKNIGMVYLCRKVRIYV